MRRALVTGATGFVGSALLKRLRGPTETLGLQAAGWEARIAACDFAQATVFHLAARVHRGDDAEDPFVADNVEKTRALAQAAARGGAARLVFVSSVKVHGDESRGRALQPDDPLAPRDAYARSKRDAERALAEIAAAEGLDVCIVRPPLVYGAGAGGNLRALLRLADSPWPLPFAALDNRRSFVHVDDLARLLVACGEAAEARGATFLAAHRESVSTATLVSRLRHALGRPARLYPMPARVLEAAAAIAGRREQMTRLTRSLEVDPSLADSRLGWRAEVGHEAAVAELARAWRGGAA